MINGIVSVSAGTGPASRPVYSHGPKGWIPCLAGSRDRTQQRLSLFYYLRIGLVMFFETPESDSPLKSSPSLEWPLP
ncbi:MAG: hypothetical protein Ct9H300mP30_2110 [Methanobacteriota archaeon]|nr:MAG: hypothetical protein Ct9H300mP30_2110 [Euryarchaeota archaeon]